MELLCEPRMDGKSKGWAGDRVVELTGVNYFFALTTIISPDQRQLPFDSWAARSARRRAGGEARPRPGFCS
jgi:hypothetical protein